MFFAACAASLLLGGIATGAEITPGKIRETGPYYGYAATPDGRVFVKRHATDAITARALATSECEHAIQGRCNAFSVESGVRVVVVTCKSDSGVQASFLGAERRDSAEFNALAKAHFLGFDVSKDCSGVLQQVAGAAQ